MNDEDPWASNAAPESGRQTPCDQGRSGRAPHIPASEDWPLPCWSGRR